MEIIKYCSCCSTEEELLRGEGKNELVVLKVNRFRKGGTFWACPVCDGDLIKWSKANTF